MGAGAAVFKTAGGRRRQPGTIGPVGQIMSIAHAHLAFRLAFVPRPGAPWSGGSYARAVDRLLAARDPSPAPPPDWVTEPLPGLRAFRAMSEQGRRTLQQTWRERGMALKSWWLERMASCGDPAREWMTLYWHGHFTSALRKVRVPQLMYRQNETLRAHALGSYAELLRAMVRDPAMLRYLDNTRNRQEQPNENLARELLELFTLGEGHYTEADVRGAGRALTGYSIDPESGDFVFRRRWHDGGNKDFLGRRGRFDGDDIVRILLEQPRTAGFVAGRLWRAMVSRPPEPELLAALAGRLRESGYRIDALVRDIALSEPFRAADERGRMIRSPVELVVATLRGLELAPPPRPALARACRGLGQDLLDPPSVKGWPGGTAWITSGTLVRRRQFVDRLAGRGLRHDRVELAAAPVTGGHAGSLLQDPVYQLK